MNYFDRVLNEALGDWVDLLEDCTFQVDASDGWGEGVFMFSSDWAGLPRKATGRLRRAGISRRVADASGGDPFGEVSDGYGGGDVTVDIIVWSPARLGRDRGKSLMGFEYDLNSGNTNVFDKAHHLADADAMEMAGAIIDHMFGAEVV